MMLLSRLGLTPSAFVSFGMALVCAWLMLRADLARRRLPIGPTTFVLRAVAGGLLGALAVERWLAPHIVSWYGAVVGSVLVLLTLSGKKLPIAVLLDMAAPPAAIGYSIVRGFAVATSASRFDLPVFIEMLAFAAIGWWLWTEEKRAAQLQRPKGNVFGEYLILMGAVRLATHFYTAHPSAQINAVASALAMVVGGAIIALQVPRFLRGLEEHRVLEQIATFGEAAQPEYAPPTPECPHPEQWKMLDPMSSETEVIDFLRSLVITLKPRLVVETGTFRGLSTVAIAEGMRQNGFGRVVTIEYDPKVYAAAKQHIEASGLADWVECRNQSSLDTEINGTIDILFSDSHQEIREAEVRRFYPQVNEHGLILVHDASSHLRIVREAMLRLEREGLISLLLLPTPRGLAIAQKRNGRR
jgi:predicted O-methyltransferase YrrM